MIYAFWARSSSIKRSMFIFYPYKALYVNSAVSKKTFTAKKNVEADIEDFDLEEYKASAQDTSRHSRSFSMHSPLFRYSPSRSRHSPSRSRRSQSQRSRHSPSRLRHSQSQQSRHSPSRS